MNDEEKAAARHDEFGVELEKLIRQYSDVFYNERDYEEWCDEHTPPPPDWNDPIALGDIGVVFSIESLAEKKRDRGSWILHWEPIGQMSHRTRGLLEERLDFL